MLKNFHSGIGKMVSIFHFNAKKTDGELILQQFLGIVFKFRFQLFSEK
ncbi:hypothetical protein LIH_00195 [Leptospira interrogans serovar Hardjo-prajitno]|uniref:Uncharacterized protein n=1 Tax=Leptospira interrogans serovar Hardjo str. Norma TaxID=1279460 RepID=A0A0M4MQJ5_LEPIR|nr:hypothetical protein G436_0047 [Leptospira interrogans serovar Hardjo str. Norma]ALN98778.1 hypothetical protein LIH_00195 [Leptospira interrogans serovar Hardjo-prajitno]